MNRNIDISLWQQSAFSKHSDSIVQQLKVLIEEYKLDNPIVDLNPTYISVLTFLKLLDGVSFDFPPVISINGNGHISVFWNNPTNIEFSFLEMDFINFYNVRTTTQQNKIYKLENVELNYISDNIKEWLNIMKGNK